MIKRAVCSVLAGLAAGPALAEGDFGFEAHGQATYLRQYKSSFSAAYTGPNSLKPGTETGAYTFTSTLFAGVRYKNTEFYYNPEFVSGVPLSELHGLGGFTNGDNQRGASTHVRGS